MIDVGLVIAETIHNCPGIYSEINKQRSSLPKTANP
jgi:hypothetical protein